MVVHVHPDLTEKKLISTHFSMESPSDCKKSLVKKPTHWRCHKHLASFLNLSFVQRIALKQWHSPWSSHPGWEVRNVAKHFRWSNPPNWTFTRQKTSISVVISQVFSVVLFLILVVRLSSKLLVEVPSFRNTLLMYKVQATIYGISHLHPSRIRYVPLFSTIPTFSSNLCCPMKEFLFPIVPSCIVQFSYKHFKFYIKSICFGYLASFCNYI